MTRSVVERLVERIFMLGVTAGDDERERLRKGSLTLLVALIILLSPIWIVTYVVLNRPLSAAIPAAYVLISLGFLVQLSVTKRLTGFAVSHTLMFLLLPVLLQWSLGGFVRGSAVALWAFGSPVAALMTWGQRAALAAFVAFAALILVSVLAEPALRASSEPLPEPVETAFWALNILAPLTSAFLRLVYFTRQREILSARSEELLLNILPASVAGRLKRGSGQIADRHEHASVVFADIVSFTPFAERTSPERVVDLLGRAFSALDVLTERHGLEKIKTLGDGYLAVAGVPEPHPDHAHAAGAMALEIGPTLREALGSDWPDLRVRVGIASGPVIAGVIGRRRFSYDLWGDTVNTASRMASHAEPGTIQVSAATAALLDGRAALDRRDEVLIKGKGTMTTYRLLSLTDSAAEGG